MSDKPREFDVTMASGQVHTGTFPDIQESEPQPTLRTIAQYLACREFDEFVPFEAHIDFNTTVSRMLARSEIESFQ